MPLLRRAALAPAAVRRRPGITVPALTAAGERATSDQTAKYRILSQAWQRDAFFYYNTLGECWYPTQFYAKALSKLRLFAGRKDEQGEIHESAPDSWEAQQLDRIQDPGGGRSRLLYSYGRLMFLIGETYLLGQNDADGLERWEFLSSSELRAVAGTRDFVRYDFPGATPKDIPDAPDDDFLPTGDAASVYRFWMPHPEYSKWPDSPVRSVLPLYKQLVLMESSLSARLQSRLAGSGILLIADEISFGAPDGKNDDNPNVDPTAQMLQLAFVNPIRNPGSAGQVAPIIVRTSAELIAGKDRKAMEHIQIHDPNEVLPELQQWEKVVGRLAIGLDLPPEILLGMGDATRWSSWQIDDQTWTAHLQPVAQMLVDNLGSAYLRPLARKEGQENPGDIVVGYDPSDIINHPDRTKDAQKAYEDGVLGSAKYLDVIGFNPETDGPTEEEHREWLLIKLRASAQALELQAEPGGPSATAPGAEPSTPVVPTTLQQESLENEEQQVSASALLAERVIIAADLELGACRRRAGARIAKAAKRDDLADVSHALVAATLGEPVVRELGFEPRSLVAGAATGLRQSLPEMGVGNPLADRIALLIERHAAATLFDPVPLSDSFRAYVRKALAGGNGR